MKRITGTHVITTTLGEPIQAFVPHPFPPAEPALAADAYTDLNHQAELALSRLAGLSGLVPSVDWLLYSAIRREALLTSQIEGTQATLTDLFDEEAGLPVDNTGSHQLPARLSAGTGPPARPQWIAHQHPPAL